MQIIQTKSNFIEKVLRDKDGRLVRATFCVYENAGRIKARLVSVVYLKEKTAITNSDIFFLPGFNKKSTWTSNVQVDKYVSPFVILESIYISGSKPRAPTL